MWSRLLLLNTNIPDGRPKQSSISKLLTGIKNASFLAIGNLVIQVITLIGFIYIARMLGPDDYGIYVTVGAFVGIFDLLLLGGLGKAILREASKDLSSMHIVLEKTIALRNFLILGAIIACIICSFFVPYEFQIKLYIILFSLQLADKGIRGFLGTIYQATEKMQYISMFGIVSQALFVSLSIIFLYYGFGLLTLFLVLLFSHFSTLIIYYKHSQKYVNFNFFSRFQFDRDLVWPAFIFSLMGFVGFLITRIDLLMISFLGNSNEVGIYGVAYRIASQGVMLRNVTATAFFPISVKRFHKSPINSSRLLKYSLFFFGGIFVLSLAASLFIEDIITFLFGAQFKYSGEILRVLIFSLAFSWATLPYTTAAQATHNEKYMVILWSVMAGLNVVLNYIFYLKYGLIGIAYSTLVVFAVGGFLVCSITYRIMKKQGHLV